MTGRSPVFTIGYAQATQDGLVAALVEAQVEVLADVRALASSRRPGFAKTSLRAAVEGAGLAYLHLRHLGTPKEGRDAARRGDYVTLARVYAGQLALPEALAQMAQLDALAGERRVALLCYCAMRVQCHRGLLVEALFSRRTIVDLVPTAG